MKTERDLATLEQRILSGLSTTADNPVWLAVLTALDYEIECATDVALTPDLANESRQFNAGAASRLRDFKVFLQEKFDKAHSDGPAGR